MSSFIQWLGWALLHALWQGCLLALVAALVGLSLRGRARHRLNGLLLLFCLLLPVVSAWRFHGSATPATNPNPGVLVALEVHATAPVKSRPAATPLLTRLETAVQPHLPLLVALWALGAGLMALRLGGGHALNLRWKRQGAAIPDPWQRVADALAKRLGLAQSVRLLRVAKGQSPVVVGLWRPVVLVPAALLTSLPPAYLEALLAHELAHVHRLDHLGNLLQAVVEALLFFHPAVWWLSARIRSEREELADHLAAQILEHPRHLALALDALDDLQSGPPNPLFPALAARGGHLLTRIEALISPRPAAGSPWGLLGFLLIPCTVLALQAAVPPSPAIGAPVEVLAQLDALAAKEGLDPQLLRSMAWVESGFNRTAKSPRGATGLLQVMPATARTYGAADLNDSSQVMAAGAKYLRHLLERYQGDVQKAVAAYNCGEQALEEGRISEEAIRYRTLVLDVWAAKAVQPEAPLADGEVQGVLRRNGDKLAVTLRARAQGNLKVRFIPEDKAGDAGEINIGEKVSDQGMNNESLRIRPWMDFTPRIVLDGSKTGASLLIRAEDPGTGWRGEVRVPLDAPWRTFTFRLTPPRP